MCQMGKLPHWNKMPNQIINAKGWRINLTTNWLLYDQQHSQLTSHSVIFNPLLNHVNSDGSVHTVEDCAHSQRECIWIKIGEKNTFTSSSSIPSRAGFYCVQHCCSVDHFPTKQFKFTTTGLEYPFLVCTDVEVNQTIKHVLNMNLSQFPRLSFFLYLCI